MKKVGIVFPTLNNFKGLAEAIASVQTAYDWTPYVWPNWRLNDPLSHAWNEGSKQAIAEDCDYILICNDDILFSPDTIDGLVEHLDKNKECVLVSATDRRGELPIPHDIFNYPTPTEIGVSEHPDFACFMIRPKTLEQVGLFDENFVPAYFEDNDYHYRIKLLGLVANATLAAPFYHFGSQTQNSAEGVVVPSPVFEKNREYYAQKWGGFPGNETYKTPFGDPNNKVTEWSKIR
jgi:hypothetical protein